MEVYVRDTVWFFIDISRNALGCSVLVVPVYALGCIRDGSESVSAHRIERILDIYGSGADADVHS